MCVNISDSDWNCKMLNGLCKFKCKPKGMEACSHFRGATLNARPAGVFWLLEEEILHKERRDFVRRQNRGVRKICRGKRRKSPDRFTFISWPKAGILLAGGLLI